MRRHPWSRLVAAAATLLVVAAAPAVARAGCRASWRSIPVPAPVPSSLIGVTLQPDGQAWAVGFGGWPTQTLTERWDGNAWTIVPSPNTGAAVNKLLGVAADGPNGLVAVGGVTGAGMSQRWDGTQWTLGPDAPDAGNRTLLGVAKIGPDDFWAVGYAVDGVGTPVIERWRNGAWQLVPVPAASGALWAVVSLSPTDAWAVGSVVMHWDGTSWTLVDVPAPLAPWNPLYGIAAASPTDIWAMGLTTGLHWDGTSWTPVPVLSPMSDVAVVSPGDVWAVGAKIQHWDGRAWSLVRAPDLGPTASLFSVTALPDGRLWAVGSTDYGATALAEQMCELRVLDSGLQPRAAKSIPYGTTVAWNIDSANTLPHGVADASGLGLFDSGLRPPGASFTYTYTAAGTFDFVDPANGAQGSVAVPMSARPAEGGTKTVFAIGWSSAAAAGDAVFDVQVVRPGAPGFVDLFAGTTARALPFVPDAGTGTYTFRARLRNTRTHAVSGWSPEKAVPVG
jgi:hypothetical protein